MLMPGRLSRSDLYRYGFNGKENDNDVKGLGNQQDYGMRIYDPRLTRFFTVDPITKDYPELTPYQFASNTPIQAKDLDGLEADIVTVTVNFFKWLFGNDVEQVKDGTDRINDGISKQFDGPNRAIEYEKISNDENSDYDVNQYNELRKIDGLTETIGGTAELADGINSIGGKAEAIVTLGLASGSAVEKIVGKAIIQKNTSNTLINEIPVSPEVKRIKAYLNDPIVTSENVRPKEAYNRTKHYGNTPTKADRKALGAKPNEVLDHKTPLVQHYYEGDGSGGKPGHSMSAQERKDFAKDRKNMQKQPRRDSNKQGGKMSNYSKKQKEKNGL